MVKSRVLNILRSGGYVKLVAISRLMDPWLTELAGRIGYDAVWLDLEHRPFGYGVIDPVSMACRLTGMDLMVRIRKHGYDNIMRALEFGGNGIMVPHCRTAEEARQYVEWMRFPPEGKRGFDGAGADALYGEADAVEHVRHANRETFLVLQIEDKEAVEAIDEIAAVPGYDLLFVGPGDLTLSYGVPMQFDHPLVQNAYDRVAAAAQKHGKFWGTTSGSPEAAQRVLDRGGRMVVAGSDHAALVNGLKNSFRGFGQVAIRG
jgi:4-hydroxy-2-oxoheptanedioate aldolase